MTGEDGGGEGGVKVYLTRMNAVELMKRFR